jgi:maltooligosyltrehalose synthase
MALDRKYALFCFTFVLCARDTRMRAAAAKERVVTWLAKSAREAAARTKKQEAK